MLMTWKAKDRWLGKDPKVLPKVIKEHFDGSKFRECQAFWNLEGSVGSLCNLSQQQMFPFFLSISSSSKV
jgi:hypothetical protein